MCQTGLLCVLCMSHIGCFTQGCFTHCILFEKYPECISLWQTFFFKIRNLLIDLFLKIRNLLSHFQLHSQGGAPKLHRTKRHWRGREGRQLRGAASAGNAGTTFRWWFDLGGVIVHRGNKLCCQRWSCRWGEVTGVWLMTGGGRGDGVGGGGYLQCGWGEITGIFELFVLVGCLTSQQHASVSQGRICSDNFTCYHTEIEVADPTFHLSQSQYTDTRPTSPSTDSIRPGAWQDSHWRANF